MHSNPRRGQMLTDFHPPIPELIQNARQDNSDESHWNFVQNELDICEISSQKDQSSDSPSSFELVNFELDHRLPAQFQHTAEFEMVDSQPLIDIQPISKELPNVNYPVPNSIGILHTEADGYRFDSDPYRIIKLARGTLVKPTVELNPLLAELIRSKISECRSDDTIGQDLLDDKTFVLTKKLNMMWLSQEQAIMLLSGSPETRYHLHRDLERWHFVEHLKVGDVVAVECEEIDNHGEKRYKMYQGHITWMGEKPDRLGTWYDVRVEPQNHRRSITRYMNVEPWESPHVIHAGATQLHKPIRTVVASATLPAPQHQTYREMKNPEVRNIPIRRVETTFGDREIPRSQPYRLKDNIPPMDGFNRDLAHWNGDPRTINEPLNEWKPSQVVPQQAHGRSRQPSTSNGHHQAPTRSQSAHTVTVHERTFSIDDPLKTNGARIGDRCIWNDGHRANRGTIRFIGHLKGHTSIYAGVEFDEAVGKGTGVYMGEAVFVTPENKAGFVVLSSLEVLPRPGGTEPTPMRVKQASAESLSLSEFSGQTATVQVPPVPRRPPMQPEDYMIESFSPGSYVEVCHLGACRYGVVRWVGDSMSEDHDHLELSAIVELDDDIPSGWRMATESPASSRVVPKSVLVPTFTLRRDRRFNGSLPRTSPTRTNGQNRVDFGSIDSGIETTPCPPWKITDDLIGRMKGIQGHRNSCYLDATLYAMFSQSSAFDFLLERSPTKNDIPQYSELLRLLATEIVYPLRKFHYVRADHVMKVRELLSQILPNMKGLTTDEKDPEEVLVAVFSQILKAEPFLQLVNLSEKKHKVDRMYLCPIIVEDWQGGVATTQHLLERSMRSANVKFAVPPRNLILQLPRYGQQKVFDKILPLERIDITGLVHGAVIPCNSCSKPAEGMCPECFLCKRVFLSEVSFCENCFKKVHMQAGESDHDIRRFYPSMRPSKKVSSHRMSLSAVLCIETSHYVAFVRSGDRWLFFDSMADREGLSDGFNVPQVKDCDKMSSWLSLSGWKRLLDSNIQGITKTMLGKGSDVDPLVNRLLSDSYICFYNEDAPSNPSSSSTGLANLLQKIKL